MIENNGNFWTFLADYVLPIETICELGIDIGNKFNTKGISAIYQEKPFETLLVLTHAFELGMRISYRSNTINPKNGKEFYVLLCIFNLAMDCMRREKEREYNLVENETYQKWNIVRKFFPIALQITRGGTLIQDLDYFQKLANREDAIKGLKSIT